MSYNGRRIQPPDIPAGQKRIMSPRATDEIKARAVQLKALGRNPRQISRMIFRETGIGYSETAVANWVKPVAKPDETE